MTECTRKASQIQGLQKNNNMYIQQHSACDPGKVKETVS